MADLETLTRVPEPGADAPSEQRVEIMVVFTSTQPTLAALERAAMLASDTNGRITLIVPMIVPYPLPLSSPPVLAEFNERRFRAIAQQSRVETTVQVFLCRDRNVMLASVLARRSVVVIGLRRRSWWPVADRSLIARLRRAGHQVVVVDKTE